MCNDRSIYKLYDQRGEMLGRTSKLEGTNEPKREIAGKERPKGLLLLSLEIYTAE